MVEPHFPILSTQPIAVEDQNLIIAEEQAASRPSLKPGLYCARVAESVQLQPRNVENQGAERQGSLAPTSLCE